MLETIVVILFILWLFGFFAIHVGPLVHVLLIVALVMVALRVLRGKRVF
jgi:hypothetical protein